MVRLPPRQAPERERPPERVGGQAGIGQALDDRDRGRRVRDVVDDRGREGREPEDPDRRHVQAAAGRVGHASAIPPTMPTWTTPSTSMNSPMKKNSVCHSMSRSASCGSSGPTIIRTVAPSSAMVAASRPSAEWSEEPDDRQAEDDQRPDHQRPVGDRRGADRSGPAGRADRRRPPSRRKHQPHDHEERDQDHQHDRREVDQEVAEARGRPPSRSGCSAGRRSGWRSRRCSRRGSG